ncbi:hypothetical protein CC78DRAFT_529164 [Lojkania enalia]|uniref:Uncharacterized protein n=1 Tax=Lojkania enalia TaxID=147567 RepID=A0A9P4NA05_9PLEO|nr:hypothetical protein CC78DRAFT_529164 [Didymosphaeria enalia]
MRLATTIVALCDILYGVTAFVMPPVDILGLVPRDSTTDPCSLVDSPTVNASIRLSSWMECQVNGFFPYPENGAWDQVFAKTFSTNLLATFNDTHYNYDSWLKLYQSFNVTLGKNFAPFKHGIINTVAVPNPNGDRGGFVYMIGWEGGNHTIYKRDLYFTDAVFAVVKIEAGQRKIAEFRESSNIPNTAPMPDPNEWTCDFIDPYTPPP